MLSDLTRIVGGLVVAVNFFSAFAILSQIRLTYRRKNTIGISRVTWMMGATNAFAGLIYSLLIADLVFTFANLAWFLVNGTMVVLVLRYRHATQSVQQGVEYP